MGKWFLLGGCSVLKMIGVMVAQFYGYSKNHQIVYF